MFALAFKMRFFFNVYQIIVAFSGSLPSGPLKGCSFSNNNLFMTFAGSTWSPEKTENEWNTIIHREDKSTEIWNINITIYPHLKHEGIY